VIYAGFMNEKTIFRVLYYRTLNFGLPILLLINIIKLTKDKLIKYIYVYGIVFLSGYLLLIYLSCLINKPGNFFENIASYQWGIVLFGWVLFTAFILGVIFYWKTVFNFLKNIFNGIG
jgi:hypothetical protein